MSANELADRLAGPQDGNFVLVNQLGLLVLSREIRFFGQHVVRSLRWVEFLKSAGQLEAFLCVASLEVGDVLLGGCSVVDSLLSQLGDLDSLAEEDCAVDSEAEAVLDEAFVDVYVLDLVSFEEGHAGGDEGLFVLSERLHFVFNY